jgi:hypothetical protein
MAESEARKAAEDIEKGEELLKANPAPQPSEKAVAEIKSRVASALRQRHRNLLQRRVLEAVGVAAVLVVGAFLSLRLLNNERLKTEPVKFLAAIPDSAWEGGELTSDISILSQEIETIENELTSSSSDDAVGNGNATIGDLEMEFIEISGDLWKG